MSYKNKIVVLVSILGALALIFVAGKLFSPGQSRIRTEAGRLFSGKSTDVQSIQIGAQGVDSIKLVKDGAAWFCIEGDLRIPAQAARVDAFLEELAAIDILSPRSRGGANASAFDLDGDKGTSVLITGPSSKSLADFVVGKAGAIGRAYYVKVRGKEEIYAVDGAFQSYLGAGRASWLDMRLSKTIKVEDVQSLSLSSKLPIDASGKPAAAFSWTAARKDGGWSASTGPLDTVSVESLIRSLVNLSGEDFVAAPPSDAFTPALCHFEIGLGSGEKAVFEIGKSAEDKRYYLKAVGSPFVYLVSLYSLSNILRPESSLVAKK